MRALVYTLELQEPLLVTALAGDPGASESYDYIPGSTLRGLLATRFADGQQGAGQSAAFRRLFLSGAVRFLHAYPVLDGLRAIPTPLPLRGKDNEDDRFRASGSLAGRPSRTSSVHVQRDPLLGRAVRRRRGGRDQALGTVFRYEALSAGQRFAGAILADDERDLATLKSLFEPRDWLLGRSRGAAFGRAKVVAHDVVEWDEVTPAPAGPHFSLVLLSDTILRDRLGRPVVAPDDTTLSAALGIAVQVQAGPTDTKVRSTMAGGFNRHWRLPLPQSPALAAGSVIALRTTNGQPPLPDRIAALLRDGIGERRAEGFGRVALNWDSDLAPGAAPAEEADPSEAPPLAEPGLTLARSMARRLLDLAIDEAILRFVQGYVWPETLSGRMPSNSQLARLRVLARRAQPSGDTAMVLGAFEDFRPTAKRAYERARLRGQPLDRWVQNLLARPQNVWHELAAERADAEGDPAAVWDALVAPLGPIVAGQRAPYDPELAPRVALRLLAAVLEAPGRQRKNQEQGNG